jgi:hypothetical protein
MFTRFIFIIWVIIITFSVCFLLSSCSNKTEVPAKIKHEGIIHQVISIEISIPKEITDLYKNTCKDEYSTTEEVDSCSRKKQEDYVSSIMNLIKQFQSTVVSGGSL